MAAEYGAQTLAKMRAINDRAMGLIESRQNSAASGQMAGVLPPRRNGYSTGNGMFGGPAQVSGSRLDQIFGQSGTPGVRSGTQGLGISSASPSSTVPAAPGHMIPGLHRTVADRLVTSGGQTVGEMPAVAPASSATVDRVGYGNRYRTANQVGEFVQSPGIAQSIQDGAIRPSSNVVVARPTLGNSSSRLVNESLIDRNLTVDSANPVINEQARYAMQLSQAHQNNDRRRGQLQANLMAAGVNVGDGAGLSGLTNTGLQRMLAQARRQNAQAGPSGRSVNTLLARGRGGLMGAGAVAGVAGGIPGSSIVAGQLPVASPAVTGQPIREVVTNEAGETMSRDPAYVRSWLGTMEGPQGFPDASVLSAAAARQGLTRDELRSAQQEVEPSGWEWWDRGLAPYLYGPWQAEQESRDRQNDVLRQMLGMPPMSNDSRMVPAQSAMAPEVSVSPAVTGGLIGFRTGGSAGSLIGPRKPVPVRQKPISPTPVLSGSSLGMLPF